MGRAIAYLSVIFVAAGVIGGGYWWFELRKAGEDGRASGSAQAQDQGKPQVFAAPVEVARARIDKVTTEISALGSLQANEAVSVQSEASGRIVSIDFAEGQAVGEGDVLVGLDKDVLLAELQDADANLVLSKANFERTQSLHRQGTATGRSLDEALAQLRSDQARFDLARARLEKATIRAPFEGVVGLREVSIGQYITPSEIIVTLQDIDPLKVDFRVPEIYLASVRIGQAIDLVVDALPGQSYTGEIYAIDPQVDVNGRALRVRAQVPNPERRLSPGLFARVNIIVEERSKAVLVPESAVVPIKEEKFVYRVVDEKAVLTKVEIGRRLPGEVEVIDGLTAEDLVIVAGQQRVRDGAPVSIISEAGS